MNKVFQKKKKKIIIIVYCFRKELYYLLDVYFINSFTNLLMNGIFLSSILGVYVICLQEEQIKSPNHLGFKV